MKLLTVLASIGAINWLLVAFGWNLVEALLGVDTILTNAVYIIVGISGILLLVRVSKKCSSCEASAKEKSAEPMMEEGAQMGESADKEQM